MKFATNLLIYTFLLFLISACSSVQQGKDNDVVSYLCDVEKIDLSKNEFSEVNQQNIYFQNPGSQSADFAYTGKYSIKLFPGNPYGLTTDLKNVKPDDYLQITAWRKSKNRNGVISIDGGKGFYYAAKEVIEEGEDGWHKISAEYFVPPNFYGGKMKIYLWNNGGDTIYFDDLSIVHRRNKEYPDYSDVPGFQLHVDERDLAKLGAKRLTAFETTVLVNSDEDYSKMVLFSGNDFLNGNLRLKGDLIDHLQGQKWSYRIKLKKEFAWNGLRTFSIQNPSTRYFLHEWIAHKIFEQEDVLTTRYGFVPVQINKIPLGIYAWEEHFEKQLVESRNRREGPIIRFNESVFWQTVIETKVTQRGWDIDFFSASKIIPFKEGQITADSLKTKQFEEAQNLLFQYKNRTKTVSEIFDVDKLAAYYALMDLTQAYHGFAWHNQRYYYNPVVGLLEPIAFDGFIETGIYKRIDEPVTGLLNPSKIASLKKEELMLFQVFSDSLFNRKYIENLEKFSKLDFVEDIVSKYKNETDSLSELIHREFPAYNFNFEFIKSQAEFIRNNLPGIETNVAKIGEAANAIDDIKFKKEFTKDINENLIPFQIHAFYNSEKKQIELLNFTNLQVKVLGAFMNDQLPVSFEDGNNLEPFNGLDNSGLSIPLDGEPVKVLLSINKEMYETEISNWNQPQNFSSRQNALNESKTTDLPWIENTIVFDGDYTFDEDLIIPANKIVRFKAGTKIDFVKNAGFFSFSTVVMEGTEINPIEIRSSDRTANGFNVLQANSRSKLQYVYFTGLSKIGKGGWQTPSAVTFYEADVDFDNCIFASNSNCDDALNVVRSNFNANYCTFENTFADAFDSDFCTGEVVNCTFKNIGNDAIDFSGSQVKIADCKMFEITDKAISGGENSLLMVTNCEIEKANIGVAAKDLSTVLLDKISMNTTVYGLVAFVKKPEYGPAKIEIENLKMKDNVVFHQIELGSTLKLNGKLIEGREKKLALKLYQ
ncbi:MAG: CotH kinase family protein [Bacteroidetes bacterium]|nr:CotH kinase family protein [Bacteroidota bacterium]